MPAFKLTEEQEVDATVEAFSAAGNPAKIDGVPTWTSSDPAIVGVTPSSDGMSAVIFAVGPVGNAQISVEADADLGAGVRKINQLQDIEVVAAEATSLSVKLGEARTKPVA